MIGRLRSQLARPLTEDGRRRGFAVAAAVLVLAAVALSLSASPPAGYEPAPPASRPSGPSRAEIEADAAAPRLAVARLFLRGYLRHLYGRGRAEEARGATRRLRRELAATPLRVSPAMRERWPRIAKLSWERIAGGWLVSTTIDDGGIAAYPIMLKVEDRQGGPLVTRLVED